MTLTLSEWTWSTQHGNRGTSVNREASYYKLIVIKKSEIKITFATWQLSLLTMLMPSNLIMVVNDSHINVFLIRYNVTFLSDTFPSQVTVLGLNLKSFHIVFSQKWNVCLFILINA